MKPELDCRCLIISSTWLEQANEGIARLNRTQPCYFLVTMDFLSQLENLLKVFELPKKEYYGQAALLVLPKVFAKSKYIPFWPKLIQSSNQNDWVCGLFFADHWDEVEGYLLGFSGTIKSGSLDVHVSCQYQNPYTDMLELWTNEGSKPYHPGDYFKEDFLLELQKMTGIWAYWGHAEGDKLRGYSHLTLNEILTNSPSKPFLLTLWFTCSTLDPEFDENIGLSWFLSGKTQCLLASPFKVKTEENQLLGKEFLKVFTQKNNQLLSEILLCLVEKKDDFLSRVMNHYCLLGSPWIEMRKPIQAAK